MAPMVSSHTLLPISIVPVVHVDDQLHRLVTFLPLGLLKHFHSLLHIHIIDITY